MAFYVAGTMATVAVVGAVMATKENNARMDRISSNAKRKYNIETGIAEDQMEEQQMMALEKMTDISRSFLLARGRATAMQAESNVAGNVAKRKKSITNLAESEAKGEVAKEINTNVINIAQGMIAKKIDTEAIIEEAMNSKKNVFVEATLAGVEGYTSGYVMGSNMTSAKETGVKN